jgi:hypothetical protein
MQHGSVQVDGLALEFNVLPSKSRQEFVNNTIRVYRELNSLVKEQQPEAKLHAVPTVYFGEDYIRSLPEDVQRLGCNPDFCAYTRAENPVPDAKASFRTGAGHIHVGWTQSANPMDSGHFDRCIRLTKEMDYFVGLPSLGWDQDRQRRTLYGRAGAFRPKPYGLEYRVLSNAWLADKALMGLVFDQTVKAVKRALVSNEKPMHEVYGDYAQEVINTSYSDWIDDKQIYQEVFDAGV